MDKTNDIVPPPDPWTLFEEWYGAAQKGEPSDPNAMALATVGADGMPSVRMVLFKGHGQDGFVFLTNRESVKGDHLARNPQAGVCLHWKSLQRQVRAEGPISPISDAESDAYYATRPRESRIGAWVSQQSRPLESRAMMDRSVAEWEKKFEGKDVPRPPYWGGYRLQPLTMEFWIEGRYRLHNRVLYSRRGVNEPWTHQRLYP